MSEIQEKPRYGEKRKKITLLLMFAFFIIVVGLLVTTAFYSGIGKGITGFVSFSQGDSSFKNISKEGIYVQTSLTIPKVELDQNIERIEITRSSDSNNKQPQLSVGDSVYPQSDNIILSNFNGDFSFTGKNILKLKGKADSVVIEDTPVASKSGKMMKVSFESQSSYSTIKLYSLNIKELGYETTGNIKIGSKGTEMNLKNEKIKLEKFQGDLDVKQGNFALDGYLKKLTKKGKPEITVSS